MRMRFRLIVILAVALAFWPIGSRAATTMTASVDKTNVSMGSYLTLTITVESGEQQVPTPQLPELSAFDVYSSGQSQNISWINGNLSSSISFTYILSPKREGQFVIAAATVNVGGQSYASTPITVNVMPARTAPTTPSPPASAPPSAEGAQRPHDRQIFITAELDRESAYVNQPVTYIFRFYQGEPLLGNPEYTRPSLPGFWVEDLPPQRKFTTVTGNVRYEVTEIRTALFPTDAGVKAISPAEVKATVRSRRRTRVRDPFGFFGDDFLSLGDRGESLNLVTKSLKLNVLPLPTEGRPDDFSGVVGQYTLDARADVRTVNVGDPITVTVTVTGEGNVKSVPAPRFDSSAAFRTLPAGTSEQIATSDYKVSGKKVYEYVFVPQRPGTYRVPSFSFSYFDPNARRYRTLRTDSLEVTATGAAADFTIPSLSLNKDQVSDLAADVRFLKTDGSRLRLRSGIGVFGWAFWLGHAIPLMSLVGFMVWRRRELAIAADPVGRRRRSAYRTALAQLSLATGDRSNTADNLATTLLQYYCDRFNRAASGVHREEMRNDFTREGIPTAHIEDFLTLLDECDRSRYAGTSGGQSGGAVADRARQVLARLEGVSR